MERRITGWFSHNLNAEMPLVAYGHSGQPLLMFPTAAADYLEYERFHLVDAIRPLIESGKISGKQGREVFAEMFATGKRAGTIVKEKGIEQLSDTSVIEKLCDEVIAANPKPAADFKAGNAASLNFLKGQVMKLSKGQANPQLAGEILERKLKG